MTGRTTLAAIGGGAISALFFLSILTGSPGALILAYLTPLPLLAAGLGLGFGGAVAAGLAGSAAVAVIAGPAGGVAYGLGSAVPVALAVHLALLSRPAPDGGAEWYPPGRLLVRLIGYGLAMFLILLVAASGEPGGLRGMIETRMAATLTLLMPMPPGSDAAAVAAALGGIGPGVVILSWVVMLAINGALAQGALMRFGANRRPALPVSAIEMPGWAAPVLAAAVIAVLGPGTLGFIATTIAIALGVGYFFAGLAVVHALVRRTAYRIVALIALYGLMVVFGWPILIVIGLGFAETWTGLRRRATDGVNRGVGREDG